jgi:hypothetical protein
VNTRKGISLIVVMLIVLALAGCYTSSDNVAASQVENQQQVYLQNQPIPSFDYSLERDVSIQLYKIRNEARNTYTVVTGNTGTAIWMCPSIGYPIPYDVQLTNPLRAEYTYSEVVTLEQPEPNGLYSSDNAFGTWVLCVNSAGDVTPVYTELSATSFPFPVKIENGVIVPVDDSAPSVVIELEP